MIPTKLKLILLSSSLIIALTACTTYKEYNEDAFPNYAWEPNQIVTFKPNIEDIDKIYRMGFGMRHVYGLANNSINITVRSTSPSGKTAVSNYDFMIMDKDGDYLGSCAGDMCDLESFVSEYLKFDEPGEHIFELTYNGKYRVSGVTAIGLIIDEK